MAKQRTLTISSTYSTDAGEGTSTVEYSPVVKDWRHVSKHPVVAALPAMEGWEYGFNLTQGLPGLELDPALNVLPP